MKYIVRELKVNKENFLVGGLIIGVAVLIGFALFLLMDHFVGTEEGYLPVGMLMAMILGVLYSGTLGMFQMGVCFDMAVSMGATRKQFILGYMGALFLFNIALCLLIGLLGLVETGALGLMFKGTPLLLDPFGIYWKLCIPAAVTMTLVSGFIGMFCQKYGRKAMAVVWVFWMAGCLLPRVIRRAMENAPDSFWGRFGNFMTAVVGSISREGLIGAVVVLNLVCLVGIWVGLRRQQVQY